MDDVSQDRGAQSNRMPSSKVVKRIRSKVYRSLRKQGFRIYGGRIVPPEIGDKSQLRALHEEAVRHNRARSRAGLKRHENQLLSMVATGPEVTPEGVSPVLVEVQPRSQEELLFRYIRLHWSIPVSAGYGRRLRFVVFDKSNDKVIGIIGIGDPVFGLGPRDRWIGWDLEARRKRLRCVMDLFVLGAVPPYSQLLCGKLVALLATSQEVQGAFRRKYGGRETYISGSTFDGRLALLTTTSALGRSSLYNRLRHGDRLAYESVGYTSGSGDFHFSNGFYGELRELAARYCEATAKHPSWGGGFRNRRELVRKTLPLLGLSTKLQYHGIRREIFAAPLARNTQAFLRGEDEALQLHEHSASDIFARFRKRWLLPRAERDDRYLAFDRESYRLWGTQ